MFHIYVYLQIHASVSQKCLWKQLGQKVARARHEQGPWYIRPTRWSRDLVRKYDKKRMAASESALVAVGFRQVGRRKSMGNPCAITGERLEGSCAPSPLFKRR